MEIRNQIHQSTRGGFLREDDLWTLISDDDTGLRNVEHQWSYVDPFGHGEADTGVSTVTLECFLQSSADDAVKDRLRALLAAEAPRGL